LLDVTTRSALLEEPAKGFVTQLARDILEGSEVITGSFGGTDQKKEQLDTFTIE
jgi:hypothetical protein